MTDAVEVLRIDSLEDERLDAYVRLTERELRCGSSTQLSLIHI